MAAVQSSNISDITYIESEQELSVEFNSGSTYVYQKVPSEVHEALMEADSHGKYLNSHIKGNYDFERLD